MDLIIRNGMITTACDQYKADLGIRGGKIVEIADKIEAGKTPVLDATGQYVLPGVIDAHVHCELPMAGTVSSDDFTNATKAAACGGVTTLVDFSTQTPGKSLMESIRKRREEADSKVCIDYSFHAGITDWAKAEKEMDEAFEAGISSFKMFMTYRNRGLMSEDSQIFRALEETKIRGGVIMVHAESTSVLELLVDRYHAQKEKLGAYAHALSRPDIIEIEAVERAIRWAELSGGSLYIVHTSTGGGAQAVREARLRGVSVYCETCPQYLLLDDSVFKQQDGHLYTSCPQIKSKPNQEKLWHGVKNGYVHTIATDHCTFTKTQKDLWQGDFTRLPFGLPGIETLLPTMHTALVTSGTISLNRLVALLCTNPAKIFGLYPQKGTLAIGSDADITIFDPGAQVTLDYRHLQTNCDWSPYQGMELTGYPKVTLSRGKVVAQEGKFVGEIGWGKFLKRGKSLGESL